MEKESFFKAVDLYRDLEKLNALDSLLGYHSPTALTVSSNAGKTVEFDSTFIEKLKEFSKAQRELLDKEIAAL